MHILRLFAACAVAGPVLAQDCTSDLASLHSPRGEFAASVAAARELLVIGAPNRDATPPVPSLYPYGRAEVFQYDPVTRAWFSRGLLAPAPTPLTVVNNEGFASSLALGSDTVFCGWPADITGGNGTVRPFRLTSGGWIEEPPILPPFASATGRFGVVLAAAGDTVIISEQLSDGMVHVATRSAAGWSIVQTLTPPASVHGTFGRSVAIADGWLFVGDPGHPASLSGVGVVEVYARTSTSGWQHRQTLHGAPALTDGFGTSLAASRDTLVVGDDRGPNSHGGGGIVYVFRRGLFASGQWGLEARLDPPPGAAAGTFGASVAIGAFADHLLVGAPHATAAGVADAGAAFLYRRVAPYTGAWALVRTVAQAPPSHGARAGATVTIGEWHAAFGAPGEQRARAFPADPLRDVDVDLTVDACEALYTPFPACRPYLNSSGPYSRLHVDGSRVIAQADLRLSVDSLPPHSFGYFLVSRTLSAIPVPGGQVAQLCLGGPIGRILTVLDSGAHGRVQLTFDPRVIPQPMGAVSALPGETWGFQYWHRDVQPGSPLATYNFSEAGAVTFE